MHHEPSHAIAPQPHDPEDDPKAYRQCLSLFATGVNVLTTRSGDHVAGLTANSFASVSLSPPLVLWSIGKTSRNYDAFVSAERFVVNFLAFEQIDVSQLFAGKSEDKFAGVDWVPGIGGVPVLSNTAGFLECATVDTHEAGDHAILIGRVENYVQTGREPLLFHRGRYCAAMEHPQVRASQGARPDSGEQDATMPLGRSLIKAYRRVSRVMDEPRRQIGLQFNQGPLLGALVAAPGSLLETVLPALGMSNQAASDALSGLMGSGLVSADAQGRLHATLEGRETYRRFSEKIAAAETRLLGDVPPSEIAILRRLLALLSNYDQT